MADKWVRRWTVSGKDDEYTVAIDRNGNWGCSCPHWRFRRKQIPDGECGHIKDLKKRLLNPPKPWPGAWQALEDLPPGDGPSFSGLSEDAHKLADYAVNEYIESGYVYSGCLHVNGMEQALGAEPWNAMKELQEKGILQVRGCQGFALELPAAIRWWLIHDEDLASGWMREGSCFYPLARYGEICQVWQELKDFQFCERCRTWHNGKHGDCEEFDFLTAEVVIP